MVFSEKKYIAKIIQQARKKKGLKQSQLAEKIGISEKHLSKIETGKNYPALDNFLRMIEVLELSFNDFGMDEKNNNSENKKKLLQIINTSTEKQIEAYIDIIQALKPHI